MAARVLVVFLATSRFGPETFEEGSAVVTLPVPTDLTPELIAYAKAATARAFRGGRRYKKAGVMLLDLVRASPAQGGLFDERARERDARVMRVLDRVNSLMGEGTLRFAAEGTRARQAWRTRCEKRSPRYTTSWQELATVEG